MLLGNEFQKAADLYTKGIWARMSNENFVPVKLAGNHLDKLSRYLKSEIGRKPALNQRGSLWLLRLFGSPAREQSLNSVRHDFLDRHHSNFSNSGVTFLQTDGSVIN